MKTRRLYKALCRAVRLCDRYFQIMENSPDEREQRYAEGMWNLYKIKIREIKKSLGWQVVRHVEQLERGEDEYYDWGWLTEHRDISNAWEILNRNKTRVHIRDVWTRAHPMPHND